MMMMHNGVWLSLALVLTIPSVAVATESESPSIYLAAAHNGTLQPGQRSDAGPLVRALVTDLRERLSDSDDVLHTGPVTLHSSHWLRVFYQSRAYKPVWLDERGRPGSLVEQLLTTLANASQDGLRPADYHRAELQQHLRSLRIAYEPTVRQLADMELLLSDAFLTYAQHISVGRLDPRRVHDNWGLSPRRVDLASVLTEAIEQRDIDQTLGRLSSPYPAYAALRQALADYRHLAEAGGWPTVPVGQRLERGSHNARVVALRKRLQVSGDLNSQDRQVTPAQLFDAELEQAVRRFQTRHGLAVDGIVGPQTLSALNVPISTRIEQLEINLERLRWLPEDLGQRYILVNIPAQRMWVIEQGQTLIDSRVVVGQRSRATPVFTDQMSYLVFSPFWHIPRSIAVRDKLPLLQRDPNALQAERIRIFSQGQQVDPTTVDWSAVNARNFNFTLRQDPGPHNALGGVKFMFPNEHNVYIHDTPGRSLFDRSQRALSSGCVRTDAPVELAEYLLRDQGNWSAQRITVAMQQTRERRVNLTEPIAVHLFYWTAWVDEHGKVHFNDDIYQRDVALTQALYRS